jgi:hypothetical protein
MKQSFLEDKTDTIRLTIYSNNRPIVPTTAYITLYKPGSDTALQARVAVTAIDATTGEMTYSLTATHTATNDLNFKAVWEYVSGGVTYYENQLFDVVKSKLAIPITDDDLFNELPSLRKANVQATGTATAGTTGTLVDTTRRKEASDYWMGGKLVILAGTDAGQERDITGFTQSTSTLTVDPAFSSAIDTTSIYKVTKSFATQIQQAFDKLETMLYNKGKRQDLILESSQIAFPLVYLVLESICRDLSDDEGDKWDRLSKVYADKFDKSFNSMTLEYDEDETGAITEDEESHKAGEIRVGRC